MNQADFNRLYKTGGEQRRKFSTGSATCALAEFFTRTQAHPPVIGFGLPKTQLQHPLVVTVGINPSAEEFEGPRPPLPSVDDVAVQWIAQTDYFASSVTSAPNADWFGLAARFLRASGLVTATGMHPCSPYSEGRAVHLDLSPLVTSAFTRTLADQVERAEGSGDFSRADLIRKSAREMLADGLREIFSPALAAIRKVNEVSAVVVFGCSLVDGGTPAVNEALRPRLMSKGSPKQVGNATVGWAATKHINISALPEHLRVIALQHAGESDFSALPFVLVSQGPSYWRRRNTPLSAIDEIGRACVEARPP
jgi:hypothetical protein